MNSLAAHLKLSWADTISFHNSLLIAAGSSNPSFHLFLVSPSSSRCLTRRRSARTCSLPFSIASHIMWHMEQMMLAVAEESIPPLRGRKKPD